MLFLCIFEELGRIMFKGLRNQWSSSSIQSKKAKIKLIKKESISLLKFLTKKNRLKLQSRCLKALKLFSQIFNDAKQKQKYKYLYPIQKSGITKKCAKTLGFKVSNHLWSKCLDKRIRNQGFFQILIQ